MFDLTGKCALVTGASGGDWRGYCNCIERRWGNGGPVWHTG